MYSCIYVYLFIERYTERFSYTSIQASTNGWIDRYIYTGPRGIHPAAVEREPTAWAAITGRGSGLGSRARVMG